MSSSMGHGGGHGGGHGSHHGGGFWLILMIVAAEFRWVIPLIVLGLILYM